MSINYNNFQSLVYANSYDIIGVTETWLLNKIYDNEILPSGYVLFRKDRLSSGGGVMLAVRSDIPCQLIDSPSELETVCVKLNYSQPVVCCLTCSYSNIIPYENLFVFLNSANISSANLILFGDFNTPDVNWNTLSGVSPVSYQFCDIIFDSGLSQLINYPTHTHGNILYLLLTNFEDLVQCISVDSHSSFLSSHHHSITFKIVLTNPQLKHHATTHSITLKKIMMVFMNTYSILTLLQ